MKPRERMKKGAKRHGRKAIFWCKLGSGLETIQNKVGDIYPLSKLASIADNNAFTENVLSMTYFDLWKRFSNSETDTKGVIEC